MVSLLDVNVLIALFDSDHVHHEIAHDWFADHETTGWATCALTENGFVRVLANPLYGPMPVRPAQLIERLRRFCSGSHHVFWGDSISLLDDTLFVPSYVAGHRQVPDVYLLGLATRMGGRLVTFDRSIPLGAVIGASTKTLTVVGPTAGNRVRAEP